LITAGGSESADDVSIDPGGDVSLATIDPDVAANLAIRNTTAWNYGVALMHLDTWRSSKLLERFDAWCVANEHFGFFAPTSVSFGLGLAYLTLAGQVACWPAGTVLDGLGFLAWADLQANGIGLDEIEVRACIAHLAAKGRAVKLVEDQTTARSAGHSATQHVTRIAQVERSETKAVLALGRRAKGEARPPADDEKAREAADQERSYRREQRHVVARRNKRPRERRRKARRQRDRRVLPWRILRYDQELSRRRCGNATLPAEDDPQLLERTLSGYGRWRRRSLRGKLGLLHLCEPSEQLLLTGIRG
jgi:hypothetical protein